MSPAPPPDSLITLRLRSQSPLPAVRVPRPFWSGSNLLPETTFPCWAAFRADPIYLGFPGGSDGKEPASSAGDTGSIRGSGRSPGEGHGDPLQCSCLEDSVGRRAWLQPMGSHRVEHVYACVHVYTRFVQLIRLEVTRHDREQPVTSFSLEYLF